MMVHLIRSFLSVLCVQDSVLQETLLRLEKEDEKSGISYETFDSITGKKLGFTIYRHNSYPSPILYKRNKHTSNKLSK